MAAAERAAVADGEPRGYANFVVNMAAADLFTGFVRPEILHADSTYVVGGDRRQGGDHHWWRRRDDDVVVVAEVVGSGENGVEIEHLFNVDEACWSWSHGFSHGEVNRRKREKRKIPACNILLSCIWVTYIIIQNWREPPLWLFMRLN